MNIDIRDKPTLTHDDIQCLNFIRHHCPYFFRSHYREGLRSRLMQVLDPLDISHEINGTVQGGIRLFPVAQPLAMLRIFKKKFYDSQEVQKEIDNYKLVQRYLPKRHYAMSFEFIADYLQNGRKKILLCGLQDYVPGEAVDPWHENTGLKIENHMLRSQTGTPANALQNLHSFVHSIKKMVQASGMIPDLAGVGNLIITPGGGIKLVDINNISKLGMETRVPIDDKGYPVSDKSIQALFQLENKILERPKTATDALYRFFLDPQRMKAVRAIEIDFHRLTAHAGNYPAVR